MQLGLTSLDGSLVFLYGRRTYNQPPSVPATAYMYNNSRCMFAIILVYPFLLLQLTLLNVEAVLQVVCLQLLLHLLIVHLRGGREEGRGAQYV